MEKCLERFCRRYDFLYEDVAALLPLMKRMSFSRGDFLIREGDTDSSFYIIGDGLWRGSYERDGESRSLWFASEGEALFSIWCYTGTSTSCISIEAMSDSTLYRIGKDEMEAFLNSSVAAAGCGRRIFEKHMLELESWMMSSGASRAKERYLALLNDNPELLMYVPLKYIASYLWITPQSLSRIRAEISRGEM